MKRIIALVMSALSISMVHSQNIPVNPFPKTIHVNGSAEMEIVPDEIYVLVILKEYEKKGSGKIDINKIKSDFLKAYKSIGLADSLISVASFEGSNTDLLNRKKRKKEELYASISYQVKFPGTAKMEELVDKLDDDATQAFRIIRTSHSKLETFRKDLKIQAVKAAKEKAEYLAGSINEQVGEAINIEEPGEIYYPVQNSFSNKVREMAVAQDSSDTLGEVDFRKIKLRFEVRVSFALK